MCDLCDLDFVLSLGDLCDLTLCDLCDLELLCVLTNLRFFVIAGVSAMMKPPVNLTFLVHHLGPKVEIVIYVMAQYELAQLVS